MKHLLLLLAVALVLGGCGYGRHPGPMTHQSSVSLPVHPFHDPGPDYEPDFRHGRRW